MKILKEHGLKILTILVAVILWFWVNLNSEVEVQKSFKLVIKPSTHHALAYQSHEEVVVNLIGPKKDLKEFYEDMSEVKISVKKENTANAQTVYLNPTHFKLPFGIRIQKIIPQEIQVVLDTEATKILPIHLIKKGELPTDLTILKEGYSPRTVKISGAQSLIKDLDHIETEEIWLNELVGHSKKNIPLKKTHQSINYESESVEFSFEIKPERANIVLKKIPITFVSQKLIKKVEKKLVNVLVLKGNKSHPSDFSTKDIKVFAEVESDGKKLVDVTLKAELPNGVYLKEIQPPKIKVWLEE